MLSRPLYAGGQCRCLFRCRPDGAFCVVDGKDEGYAAEAVHNKRSREQEWAGCGHRLGAVVGGQRLPVVSLRGLSLPVPE